VSLLSLRLHRQFWKWVTLLRVYGQQFADPCMGAMAVLVEVLSQGGVMHLLVCNDQQEGC